MRKIVRKATNIASNKEGATAVEFAIVAPILLLLIMGTIDVGLIMFAQSALENAAFSAARTAKTGYSDDGETREETVIKILNEKADSLFDTNKIVITSKSYSQFGNIGSPEPFVDTNENGIRDEGENYTDVNMNGQYDEDMGVDGLGNAGEILVYTISYPWNIHTPIAQQFIGTDGVINLTARMVVLNEPY